MSAAILFVLACEHGQEVDIAFLLEHVDAARKPCQSQHRDYEPDLYHRAHRVAAVIVTAGRGAGRYRAGPADGDAETAGEADGVGVGVGEGLGDAAALTVTSKVQVYCPYATVTSASRQS